MKRFILFVSLSLGLAIATTGCAHGHLSKAKAKDAALGVAVFAAVITAAVFLPCSECKETQYGPAPSLR